MVRSKAWYLDVDTIIGDTIVVGEVLKLIMEDGRRRGLHLNIENTEVFWPKEDPMSKLVMNRVVKSIELINVVAKIHDPQCELLLLCACAGISKLTASGLGFGDWEWRLSTLHFAFVGLGVYSTCDVLNYSFLASRLQSARLQTKLLRHFDIATFGPAFENALSAFNSKMDIDLLSNPSEVAALKPMKKLGGSDLWVRTVDE
ncbi:hypothetical protein Tco_1293762 [Tanacetum coccineum]